MLVVTRNKSLPTVWYAFLWFNLSRLLATTVAPLPPPPVSISMNAPAAGAARTAVATSPPLIYSSHTPLPPPAPSPRMSPLREYCDGHKNTKPGCNFQPSARTQPRTRAVDVRNGERLFPLVLLISLPMVPCRQQRLVVSELLFSSLVWTLDSDLLSPILAVNRFEESTRCDCDVWPLTSLSLTRTQNASSSWKLHAPTASSLHKLLARQLLFPVPTESMAAGHSAETGQLDLSPPWPAG